MAVLERVSWVGADGRWTKEHLTDGRGSTLCGKPLDLVFSRRRISPLKRIPDESDGDFCAVCAAIVQEKYGQPRYGEVFLYN